MLALDGVPQSSPIELPCYGLNTFSFDYNRFLTIQRGPLTKKRIQRGGGRRTSIYSSFIVHFGPGGVSLPIWYTRVLILDIIQW